MLKSPEFRIIVNSEAEHDKVKRILSKHFRASESGDDFRYVSSPMFVKYAECINTLWSSKHDTSDGELYLSFEDFCKEYPQFKEVHNATMAHAEELVREVRALSELNKELENLTTEVSNKLFRVTELKQILNIKE